MYIQALGIYMLYTWYIPYIIFLLVPDVIVTFDYYCISTFLIHDYFITPFHYYTVRFESNYNGYTSITTSFHYCKTRLLRIVHTGTVACQFTLSCPGVQDSRCKVYIWSNLRLVSRESSSSLAGYHDGCADPRWLMVWALLVMLMKTSSSPGWSESFLLKLTDLIWMVSVPVIYLRLAPGIYMVY